jgi:hypothetical protein
MTTQNCGNCACHMEVQQPPPNLGKQSICRLFPPTPVSVLVQDPQTGGLQNRIIPMHAITAPNLHCMQWRAAENPAPGIVSGG